MDSFFEQVLLYFHNKRTNTKDRAMKLLFSESLQKTQDADEGSCSLCCCLPARAEDKYAQEVVASEIEALTKTIREVGSLHVRINPFRTKEAGSLAKAIHESDIYANGKLRLYLLFFLSFYRKTQLFGS